MCAKEDTDFVCCKTKTTCGDGGSMAAQKLGGSNNSVQESDGNSLAADGKCSAQTPFFNSAERLASCADSNLDGVCDKGNVAQCCTAVHPSRQIGSLSTIAGSSVRGYR